MYKKILVALENGPADAVLLPHISSLAKQLGAELMLVHVADGWAARNFNQLKLTESDEMRADRAYLEKRSGEMHRLGLVVKSLLMLGSPPEQLVKAAALHGCDLIAMASHGHKIIGDLFLGSTIDKVRHNTAVPILVVAPGDRRSPKIEDGRSKA